MPLRSYLKPRPTLVKPIALKESETRDFLSSFDLSQLGFPLSADEQENPPASESESAKPRGSPWSLKRSGNLNQMHQDTHANNDDGNMEVGLSQFVLGVYGSTMDRLPPNCPDSSTVQGVYHHGLLRDDDNNMASWEDQTGTYTTDDDDDDDTEINYLSVWEQMLRENCQCFHKTEGSKSAEDVSVVTDDSNTSTNTIESTTMDTTIAASLTGTEILVDTCFDQGSKTKRRTSEDAMMEQIEIPVSQVKTELALFKTTNRDQILKDDMTNSEEEEEGEDNEKLKQQKKKKKMTKLMRLFLCLVHKKKRYGAGHESVASETKSHTVSHVESDVSSVTASSEDVSTHEIEPRPEDGVTDEMVETELSDKKQEKGGKLPLKKKLLYHLLKRNKTGGTPISSQ